MFWFGLILTVVMGLIGVPIVRNHICSSFYSINEKYIDHTRIALIFIGATISVVSQTPPAKPVA